MADGKVTCACGKQYTWKPELAGKRAKCKCGNVVSFPAQRPGDEDAPEGFGDMDEIPMAPPPPPPPMAGAGAPPPPPTRGTMSRGTMPKSGGAAAASTGFTWNWKAALNALFGLGITAFGVFEYFRIAQMEQDGNVHFTGRRRAFWNLLYGIGGKWAVMGLFLLVGISMIIGGVLVMLGKKPASDGD